MRIRTGFAMIAASAIAVAPAPAATNVTAQVILLVYPGQSDLAWYGATFIKKVECYRQPSVMEPTSWPPTGPTYGNGEASAPLFQSKNTNDLTVPVAENGPSKAIACRATILANGVDVTLRKGSGWTVKRYASVADQGQIFIELYLDRAKLDGVRPPVNKPLPPMTGPTPRPIKPRIANPGSSISPKPVK